MVVAVPDTFVDVLQARHLLQPDQLDEFVHRLQPRFPDRHALLQQLRALGWLTPYQAEQLLRGDGQGLILGSYILLERLGEGSVAQVFKARARGRGPVVAVKILRAEHAANPQTVRRFQREIWAITQLRHPNIVRIFDGATVGNTCFFVMEYVEGIDLARLVHTFGPLAPDEACDYIHQAALGLAHAHEHGLVHRDIKPNNLLLTTGGMEVKILDMGLVQRRQSSGGASVTVLTVEGTMVGTPDFVAPEQATDAHTVDGRADLYSLGCTFYFLLTGRPPFPGDNAAEKLLMHCCVEPEAVEKCQPDVPANMAAVVRRLMAKRPEDRYPTAVEAAAALAEFL